MKIWLARCLAGTIGCGGLAVLAGLLSTLLVAGGDAGGGRALRMTAILLAATAALGVSTLVVILSALQLGLVNPRGASPPTEGGST